MLAAGRRDRRALRMLFSAGRGFVAAQGQREHARHQAAGGERRERGHALTFAGRRPAHALA